MADKPEVAILRDEILVCGRFPRHDNGNINFSAIDTLLRSVSDSHHRTGILRQLMLHDPAIEYRKPERNFLAEARAL